jgi:hypothetical protein
MIGPAVEPGCVAYRAARVQGEMRYTEVAGMEPIRGGSRRVHFAGYPENRYGHDK